jgi:superfamily II DNA or RNA helicase/diadenosine tetraphosphate (Ap4A) HIT family hydrolase
VGRERCFLVTQRVVACWDAYPVSPGHALVVPLRHVATWFEATAEERLEIVQAVDRAKEEIERRHAPDGYNIGINVGAAAGQTVFHLHVHVIPRYAGDVPDPRGGIRHVIPARANYLAGEAAAPAPGDGQTSPRSLVRGGDEDPLLLHLVGHLDRARNLDVAVAFTMESGVQLVEEHFRDLLDRGGRIRMVTGDYLGVTQPEALLRLMDLQGDIRLRVFQSGGRSFHPKAYLITGPEGEGTAYIGSSNLSGSALKGGIEWNYRVVNSRQARDFAEVAAAFEALYGDPRCREVDPEWVREYAERRRPPTGGEVLPPEPPLPVPQPHRYQREALEALEETRDRGNTAGLVVLATGLGKTWLSAFDSNRPGFDRVLFVAHREEILAQAMRTFRAIRPAAVLGRYTGKEKSPSADVLFASIQTLGRLQHLSRFDPREFDYVIVDEFHHAAAGTYRRLIGYLEPRFLLGLTATPERTDGGDLLSLCGDNLVYRRDVPDGIRQGLLCPYRYFGVPDEVDYANIPWRNSRFDEEELTNRLATRARAGNALEQLRRRGGRRTIGFCASQRHADFMAAYFGEHGLRAAAVHAGPTSAPRAHSLERLQGGELDVVFAVDMFNEGVDLPDVDTILMLRPTESRILWLQQFGRGLRCRPGKVLTVVDYIGNHRVFLTKTRSLFDLGDANRDVALALDRLEQGTAELPPGCEVTYELEAIRILRALIRPTGQGEALEEYYRDFRERNGRRPTALEVSREGFNPGAVRAHHGSWPGFVRAMGDLSPEEERIWPRVESFLRHLETTPMTRSYKMVLLLAMLGEGAFPGSVQVARLTERFAEVARRHAAVRTEVGGLLDDPGELRRMLERNPIEAWTGGGGTGGSAFFTCREGVFATAADLAVAGEGRGALQDLVWELAEWRLAAYLQRAGAPGADLILCRVGRSGGRPTLSLPDRERQAGIPRGWQDVVVGRETLQAEFADLAVDAVTRAGSGENLLPSILRGWFGPEAGRPGDDYQVRFQRRDGALVMEPAPAYGGEPRLWGQYARQDVPRALGFEFRGMESQSGIVQRPDKIVLFVTLDKSDKPEAHRYRDGFLSPTSFTWQSQNRNRRESALGRSLREHRERGIAILLFVRRRAREFGRTGLFTYCGSLLFQRWEGERPITVWWTLEQPVPPELRERLRVPAE